MLPTEKSQMLHNEKNKSILVGVLSTALFCLALSVWLFFDKHVPACDEANHVMNGLTYANLLEHARPGAPVFGTVSSQSTLTTRPLARWPWALLWLFVKAPRFRCNW